MPEYYAELSALILRTVRTDHVAGWISTLRDIIALPE